MASSEHSISAYRIVAPRWRGSAFSGEGSMKYGGRWNSPGRRVVYLAESRALAALETLVHLTTPGSRSKPFVVIPVTIQVNSISDASSDSNCLSLGDAWLARGRSLALRVPSMIIPEEFNYLINPAHQDFDQLAIGEASTFHFDQRI